MYVDFGKSRGRVRFTWKELTFLASLALAAITHVVTVEVQLRDVRTQLAECRRAISERIATR